MRQVRDLYGRLHLAVEVQKTSGLDEARLVCTEKEPKSDYAKLYPFHRVVAVRGDETKCVGCFPETELPVGV